eukprot:NODE_5065_length_987_cov_98.692130_g4856_i0.p1 GENE.NODE_5065_length_987_cov_98.692130_g4856_i0~~NODE_5065_length_987_cov_98.692130_g4856_i0.p1  ORF type:complete len:155 (+),score=7.73 NODE_5065_length_987_cov_98.692130_g4856_i0:433-897(+)
MEGFKRCHRSTFWLTRCKQYGILNWVWSGAHADTGLLYYLTNMTGLTAYRDLNFYHMTDSKELVALLRHNETHVHLQGPNKPWGRECYPLKGPPSQFCTMKQDVFWELYRSLLSRSNMTRTCPSLHSRYLDWLEDPTPRYYQWKNRHMSRSKPR